MRKIIILIGAPGTGKGTLGKMLSESNQLKHISTGDIFRENMRNNTPLGLSVRSIMDSGQLCPDDLTVALVMDMIKNSEGDLILDGFPRTVAQVDMFSSELNKLEEEPVEFPELRRSFLLIPVILTFNSEDTLVNRITGIRALEGGRPEDSDADKVKHRIRVYQEETSPIIDKYTSTIGGIVVNGEQDKDKVFSDVYHDLKLW